MMNSTTNPNEIQAELDKAEALWADQQAMFNKELAALEVEHNERLEKLIQDERACHIKLKQELESSEKPVRDEAL
jgi:hypothetical protein